MNKQEILNEINKTKKHLINMEKMLKECNERWQPNDFSPYFYVDSCMKVEQSDFYSDTYIHSERYNTYSTFKTREEAEAEAEKILIRRQLEDIARRLNKGKEIDWGNEDQRKYFIRFNYWQGIIELDSSFRQQFQGVIYCLDKKFLDVAPKEIGEKRLKKYLRGE